MLVSVSFLFLSLCLELSILFGVDIRVEESVLFRH